MVLLFVAEYLGKSFGIFYVLESKFQNQKKEKNKTKQTFQFHWPLIAKVNYSLPIISSKWL